MTVKVRAILIVVLFIALNFSMALVFERSPFQFLTELRFALIAIAIVCSPEIVRIVITTVSSTLSRR